MHTHEASRDQDRISSDQTRLDKQAGCALCMLCVCGRNSQTKLRDAAMCVCMCTRTSDSQP